MGSSVSRELSLLFLVHLDVHKPHSLLPFTELYGEELRYLVYDMHTIENYGDGYQYLWVYCASCVLLH